VQEGIKRIENVRISMHHDTKKTLREVIHEHVVSTVHSRLLSWDAREYEGTAEDRTGIVQFVRCADCYSSIHDTRAPPL